MIQTIKDNFKYDPETGIVSSPKKPNGAHPNAQGYIRHTIQGKWVLAHHIAFVWMTGELPKGEVDHVNRIKHDNRWCNLREVTKSENQWNKGKQKNNTSGHVGVSRHRNKFRASIQVTIDGVKRTYGKSCDTLEEAVNARQELVAKYRTGTAPKQ